MKVHEIELEAKTAEILNILVDLATTHHVRCVEYFTDITIDTKPQTYQLSVWKDLR